MIFIPNFVCVLTNERYKTYQTGFSFCRLSHAPEVGLRDAGGAQGVKILFFSNMVMWLIKNRRGWQAELNASKFFILGSNWWPWAEVKRWNIFKFRLPCHFQRFLYQTLCVFSQIKDKKTYWTEFSLCCRCRCAGVGLGVLRGSKTLAWGFAMAPHWLHILVLFLLRDSYSIGIWNDHKNMT